MRNQINILKDKHKNQPGFVLGTGGSISHLIENGINFSKQIRLEIVIGCKQVHRDFNIDYWVCLDDVFFDKEALKLANKNFTGFISEPCDSVLIRDENLSLHKIPIEREQSLNIKIPENFTDLRSNTDTGVAALKIAYLLGLNPIFLIGLNDNIYEGRLHYHLESRRIVSKETVISLGEELQYLVNHMVRSNREVYSCSPISELNKIIKYVDINEALEEVRKL